MYFRVKAKRILVIGLVATLLFGMGFIHREYAFAERLVKEYIEMSFLYDAIGSRTATLKGNIDHLVTNDRLAVRDVVYTRQSVRACFDAFVEARGCANTYILAQRHKVFPPDRIKYNGEEILFEGLLELYEASYNLEDALQVFENSLLRVLEDPALFEKLGKCLPLVLADIEWLEKEIPDFTACDGDLEGIVFNYFMFLKRIDSQSQSFFSSLTD